MRHLWIVLGVSAAAVVNAALWGLAYVIAGWSGIVGLLVVFMLLFASVMHGVGADE